ncbi:hypothetical protein BABINDRAFT_161038 [Babjeviella inositovora NRRL Y-12698]|uniref:ABC1 atypical kinase-like domain-containing protein n=1 Tax=Babjeviella inositovora NRRL Y-12698 TaxID=984486 RepID=A0A1E3QUW5_9ASCO|nr:uncharacterized protein BABINDRAFT_161038 [Babjeviella inositovora NRRL Y-12698]ODQ80832.1 hypothetical protein BABINDRAFT_161038 [Babjeviella inositovora NRRL Y-12698]
MVVGTVYMNTSLFDRINNDAAFVTKHNLQPSAAAETYEYGLYLSSEAELAEESAAYERAKSTLTPVGLIYRARFAFARYVWEPIVTLGRFLELLAIFLPVLLAYPISYFGRTERTGERAGAVLWYRYLKWSAELAGASFIKLGQWAASRTDIFPRELCNQLGQLHLNAKAHLLHQTKRIISRAFNGLPFDEIFEEFREVPLGVGAIAQVYIARLSRTLSQCMQAQAVRTEHHEGVYAKNKRFFRKILTGTISESEPLELTPLTDETPNQWVAIKVVHPRVEVTIARDLRIMRFFAACIDYVPTMEWLSLPDEVAQFGLLMKLQLDLRIEGLNLQRFRDNFADHDDITFPKPYLEFTSREVLVEEYIHAVPMEQLLRVSANFGKGLSKEVSDKGLDAFLKMLILDNFVHADLHPGNLMVRFYKNELFRHRREYKIVNTLSEAEMNAVTDTLLGLKDEEWAPELDRLYREGYHAEVCFIDTGLVTELNEVDRRNFIDLFRELSEFDGYKAGELMMERSRTPETVVDREVFALKVERLVDKVKSRTFTLGSVSIGDLLDQVLGMVRTHHVRMEGDFITVIVAILLLEGIGRQLDPELDLFASSLPVLRQLGIQDGRKLLQDSNISSMVKVWITLELRRFINASIQDVNNTVKADMLSPNV